MKFEVSYRFWDAGGKCIRGGEVIFDALSEDEAIRKFHKVSADWPEQHADSSRVTAYRIIDDHLTWDAGVSLMASLPEQEWREFFKAVNKARYEERESSG